MLGKYLVIAWRVLGKHSLSHQTNHRLTNRSGNNRNAITTTARTLQCRIVAQPWRQGTLTELESQGSLDSRNEHAGVTELACFTQIHEILAKHNMKKQLRITSLSE